MQSIAARAERVVHTHGSTVYLVGERAYKVKKPVDFGFLDYSTAARRRHFCAEEVRLNRRWSEGIYEGVQGLDADGVPVADAQATEWAVVMRRFDDDDTLLARVERGEVDTALLRRVGQHVGRVHRRAGRPEGAATLAGFDAVQRLALDNFQATRGTPLLPAALHARLEAATRAHLAVLRPRIEARAATHAVACHGDLRLQHVLVRADRIDCVDGIEFDRGLRVADPVADVAFLWMDLSVRGRDDLAAAFLEGWLEATGDEGVRPRLPFEAAYRSIVRAKVAELEANAPEVDPAQTQRARDRARRHWLWAAGQLLPPQERPALIGVGGLPASGKSTVAEHLARAHGFRWIRSDVVRKELAGLPPDADARSAVGAGLYDADTTRRTYAACLARAQATLEAGGRAVVDATFAELSDREALHALGRRLGVPHPLWLCTVPPDEAQRRLASRPRGPSDATADVLAAATARWPGAAHADPLSTAGTPADTVARVDRRMRDHRLAP